MNRFNKIVELHKVAQQAALTLKDLCEIRTNFEDADFWMIRRGSESKVGSVTKEFAPQYIGIKVKDDAASQLDPSYLYYALMNMHSQGLWRRLSYGTTSLLNIRTEDVKNVPLG